MEAYATEHGRSLADPAAFWGEQARAVDWYARPRTVLDRDAAPGGRWFADGVLNTAYNALDRHVVRGRADEPALVFHSAYTGTRRSYSYADLLERVAQLGGALRELGVVAGDRVVVCMPPVPEAVFAMLACARIGAVHAVVPADLPVAELAARIDDARPKVVLSASCRLEPEGVVEHKPLLDAALDRATHRPDYCVMYQRDPVRAELEPGRDLDFGGLMRPGQFPPAECAVLRATDPLYLLYPATEHRGTGVAGARGDTSAAEPFVRDQGGHAVALAHAMRTVLGLGPGDVMFTASDLTGVLGHSALVYGPLLVGATTVLYEGTPATTPDAGSLWRVASEHRATVVVTPPAALRAIRAVDPPLALAKRHDLSDLAAVFLAGNRPDPDLAGWTASGLGRSVLLSWWQEGYGGPLAASSPRAGSTAPEPEPPSPPQLPLVPAPGFDLQVLDAVGDVAGPGEEGAICLRLPLPPGSALTVGDDDDRRRRERLESYPGYEDSGERGHLDQDGSLHLRMAAEPGVR